MNRTAVRITKRTGVRIAHVRRTATRVWAVAEALVPDRGLPRWEDLPAWDRLSNELADERQAA